MKATSLLSFSLYCIFSTAIFAADELPSEVIQAQKKYQKNLDTAQERYLDDLNRIRSKSLMMRDTEDVVLITREINKVLATTMAGKWHDIGDSIMYINANGSLLHSNGATGTWLINDDELLLTWNNGAKHVFPIVKTKDILQGTLITPDKETQVTLTRLE